MKKGTIEDELERIARDAREEDRYNNRINLEEKKFLNEIYEFYEKGIEPSWEDREKIEIINEIIERYTNNELAWICKGFLLYHKLDWDEAISCYDKALEINQENADTWFLRGLPFEIMDKREEALKSFKKATEKNSKHAEAWFGRGNQLLDTYSPDEEESINNYNKAIGSYDKAIGINPKHADAWNNRGIAFYFLGKPEEAIKSYNKALEMNPEDKSAWNNLGVILREMGKEREAKKCFDKAKTGIGFYHISRKTTIRNIVDNIPK